MFFTVLLFCFILVAFTLYLPYASGLTKIKIENSHKRNDRKEQEDQNESGAYVPPSFQYSEEEEAKKGLSSRASAIKEKLNITSDEMPLKIKLQQDTTLRKRNKGKVNVNIDPNTYDYDLDEIINEEEEKPVNPSSEQSIDYGEKNEDLV